MVKLALGIVLGLLISNSMCNQTHEFELIKQGSYCKHKAAGFFVVDNSTDLNNLWKDSFSEKDDIPDIDFSKNQLVAIFRGEFKSGGFGVGINSIVAGKDGVLIEVLNTDPGDNCMVSMVLTQPFAIYSIKKTEQEIKFIESTQARDCQ